MSRAEMEAISWIARDPVLHSRFQQDVQRGHFRAAAARLSAARPDLPQVVELAHLQQRVAEPPSPWTLGIAKRRAAGELPAADTSTADPLKPWSTASARRRALEAR